MKKKPIVIEVSAASGGGKTTTINELNKKLPLSRAIYFDDYEFKECPEDLLNGHKMVRTLMIGILRY